ncbi:uncharacterized protein N7458_007608 [Penicillium daleae]|uniref:Putative gamma-glutamylcyclotransferase n=1 Tax=Penicillium daleae TaxID=63821 RepID=A0AAD6C2N3_9EURO|nr:uncharacterized protein N7458_007608 [Penicillium daleae]KAJ5443736.1 hypothetical protein N7458_007608 [Penicillium daleae]
MSENRRPIPPPSRMVRKFLEYKASEDPTLYFPSQARSPRSSETDWPQTPFSEGYFFFYGTLMDSSTLAKVLQLSEPPQMRPARVIGYTTKLWGKYAALVSGKPFQPIDGLAYEIRLREEWDRLRAYHSDHYDLVPILIDFLDTGEQEVEGFAFEWRGDPEELRNGSFSLEKWLQERNLTGSK